MRLASLILLLIVVRAGGEQFVLRGAAQGTTYNIKYVADAGSTSQDALHAAIEEQLAEIDQQMSTYRDDSQISRFNRSIANEWFAVSPAVVDVVAAAQAVSEQTGGAMDITVGPLVRLWHFGPKKGGVTQPSLAPPTDAEVAAARGRVGYQKLHFRKSPPALMKDLDGLEVDLNAIAQGYSVDRLADVFGTRGIRNFVVELGGEVRAAGTRADGKPWRLAIERPGVATREMATAIPLVDAALATSGDSHKFFTYEGRRYCHLIDPATGKPVEHSLFSVSVIAEDCTTADGWSTPLAVMGAERGYECAQQHGIAALFVSHHEDGDAIRMTPAWEQRFKD